MESADGGRGGAPAAPAARQDRGGDEGFSHPAFFYRDDAGYLAGTLPFVRDGLAAGDAVAVAAPPSRLALLREALGSGATGVHFTDMTRAGRNPGRIIPGVLRAFYDAQRPGEPGRPGRVRIIGEPVWAGRTPLEYPACVQHEALINAAFEGRPATILCPYDASALDPAVLTDALATHPVVVEDGRQRKSPDYAPEHAVASYNTPLGDPADPAVYAFDDDRLRGARLFAIRAAGELGLTGPRLDDLALAVAELTTNSVLHGGGSGELRLWAEDGHAVCEVRDRGRLADPLAGRRVPPAGRPGGRGLLMVNHLADLVRTHTGPHGTTIRAYFAVPRPAP